MQTTNNADATNEYLERQDKRSCIVKRIACADGFDMSVQASKYHYCVPRTNTGPYSKVEVGYPSAPVAEFAAYRDGDSDVYGYVPVVIVNAVIAAHGGITE